MTTSIVIQHLGGSKANQIEQFPLENVEELVLGRDPASTIAFDAQRDDLVSRRHAIIKLQQGDPPRFTIADLGSANGTWLNGNRITTEQELQVGDTVELGKTGGPKFVFDLQPRPASLLGRTRIIDTAAAGATRIVNTASGAPTAVTTPSPTAVTARPGVGRETVERMLFTQQQATDELLQAQRQKTTRLWQYMAAAILVIVCIGAGGAYYMNHRVAASLDTVRHDMQTGIANTITTEDANISKRVGLSSQELARKYASATVYIEVQWRVYDRITGKPLFHRAYSINGQKLPCFVEFADHTIVPWLTTEDEDYTNFKIQEGGSATGFVIDPQGYILTSKHVAAAWMYPYDLTWGSGEGALFQAQDKLGKDQTPRIFSLKDSDEERRLSSWVPQDGGYIFRSSQPVQVSSDSHNLEGKDDMLEIRFPNERAGVAARLVRALPQADVAEIKIDTQQPLSAVELAQDDDVEVGEKVTVLGYPDFNIPNYAVFKKSEIGQVTGSGVEAILDPTVTEGIISNIGKGAGQKLKDPTAAVGLFSLQADDYQLMVSTGKGNSGGPVFNSEGKVIAIFTAISTVRQSVTYATPIKYGLMLKSVQ